MLSVGIHMMCAGTGESLILFLVQENILPFIGGEDTIFCMVAINCNTALSSIRLEETLEIREESASRED